MYASPYAMSTKSRTKMPFKVHFCAGLITQNRDCKTPSITCMVMQLLSLNIVLNMVFYKPWFCEVFYVKSVCMIIDSRIISIIEGMFISIWNEHNGKFRIWAQPLRNSKDNLKNHVWLGKWIRAYPIYVNDIIMCMSRKLFIIT